MLKVSADILLFLQEATATEQNFASHNWYMDITEASKYEHKQFAFVTMLYNSILKGVIHPQNYPID